jgi:DNA-binding transcriptional LysR family regulator
MEVRVLRYFLTVAREENITKAAEVLHITQPTLSRQLTQLEEEVGVQLFHRGARKIMLTNEGMLLRRRAEEIVDLVDKTSQELLEHESAIEGTVTLGCGELASVQILAELCGRFRGLFPRVTFDIYTATADTVKERMDRGLIDIGLLLEPIDMEKYDFIRLNRQEEWCVLMRPDDPLAQKSAITADDLAGKPLMLPRRLNLQGELANWVGRDFGKINMAFAHNLTMNTAIMASHGLGYAFVIKGGLAFNDETKIISRPLSPPLTATTVLAWKRGQPFSTATERFIHEIRSFLSMAEPTI